MSKLYKICFIALFVRLLALAIVMYFSKDLTTGFLSSDLINDDVRYLAGAENYVKFAKSLIDVKALNDSYIDVGDWNVTGTEFKLWYWIISVTMYLFHNEAAPRILNILFAVASIICIYDICKKIYGEQIASIASMLYALLPYPVFFSCFLYKDQFYTLLVLLLFRMVVIKQDNLKLKDFVIISIILLISNFIRSGLSLIIAGLLGIIYITYTNKKRFRIYYILIILLLIVGTYTLWTYSSVSIEKKFNAYVTEGSSGGEGLMSYVVIKKLTDLYRYPFALLFAMLLPVNTSGIIRTWAGLVGSLNVVIIPIAIGNFIYLLYWKYKKDVFFWCIQALYLITIITSLGIFRQQYYLQPYMMIFFSLFFTKLKKKVSFLTISIALVYFYAVALFI